MVRQARKTYSFPWQQWLQPDYEWWKYPPALSILQSVDYLEGNLAISQGNPGWRQLDGFTGVGDDFQVFKKTYTESSSLGEGPKHFSIWAWDNPLAPGVSHEFYTPRAKFTNVTDATFEAEYGHLQYLPSSMSELDALGSTAISRMLPTNPVSGLAAFLGELREGLPKLDFESWKPRTDRARAAGSDYLNAEFGWKPLLSDMRKFDHAVRNSNKIVAQYVKDSGKLLHRSYRFKPTEEISEGFEGGYALPAPNPDTDLYTGPGLQARRHVELSIKREQWCEATFVYYLPDMASDKLGWSEAISNKLYGTRITPDVVWQLTPWSWAVDWCSNIGDVAKNVSAFLGDGLIMPYAYMMEHCSFKLEYQLGGVGFKSYPWESQTLRQTFEIEVKTRRRATPFGFGFDLGTLSGRQQAIIGALAASKGGR